MNIPIEEQMTLVKKLREESGFGLIECAKALALNNFNYQDAVDSLKIKGLAIHYKNKQEKK